MSHYAIAVFSKSPDDYSFHDLLEPYSEVDEDFYVFTPVTQEHIDERWEKFREKNPAWTKENFLNEMFTLRDGVYGNWYNPNAKYDYYSLDGKDYMYELKPEVEKKFRRDDKWPDVYLKSQIDWFRRETVVDDDGNKLVIDEAYWKKIWRKYIEEGDGFWSAKYYEERYGTEEQFVKEMMRPTTPYAFVTPDGVWHAPGTVGWFACSDETAETMDAYWEEWYKFITEAPDCYVSLVDCHI